MPEPNPNELAARIDMLDRLVKETARQRQELDGRQKLIEKATSLAAQPGDFTLYNCTAALDLSTTLTDVTGMTTGAFTPVNNEYAYVSVNVNFNCTTGTAACNAGDILTAYLNTNGVDESDRSVTVAPGNFGMYMTGRWYKITLTSGNTYTLKVRARNNTGNRGRLSVDSHMMVWRVVR